MNLLRKINRHIKLIEKKIKREHSEDKANFPEICARASCLLPLIKVFPSKSAVVFRLLTTRAKRDRPLIVGS